MPGESHGRLLGGRAEHVGAASADRARQGEPGLIRDWKLLRRFGSESERPGLEGRHPVLGVDRLL
ncbi:hypothetical protein JOF56_003828 [Kibdelosporangium banguiense]|uniref:Uncharacterized protein n=1 Tax=Kibdelosporangium banguiense TaxID=1365924 RepID=A0ABS4TG90_9PSEU|nr:hypothetical protein [Kibdelosporangium banguiense]MBP2323443.1 hypothetical protein [Kibdelosporangium banguiense]